MKRTNNHRSIVTRSIMLIKGSRTLWFGSVMNAVKWLKHKTGSPSRLSTIDRHLTKCRKHAYGRRHIFGFHVVSAGKINLSKEIWKNVKGFLGYKVSNFGRVRSKDRVIYRGTTKVHRAGKFLHLSATKHHIVQAHLHRHGYTVTRDVGDLVAQAFVPNPKGHKEVLHLDENSYNNCAYNLRWRSRYEINNYGHRTQLTYKPIKMTKDGFTYVFPSLVSGAKWLKKILGKKTGMASIHSLLGSCASENTMYSHAYGFTVDYLKNPALIEVIKHDQNILGRRYYMLTTPAPKLSKETRQRIAGAEF